MKTMLLIGLFSLSLMSWASGTTYIGAPPPVSPHPVTKKPPLTADECLQQATPVLKKNHPTVYNTLLKRAAAQHSGLAALKLAEQTMTSQPKGGLSATMVKTVEHELLTAAHFGYPQQAYHALSQLAQQSTAGQGNMLLVHCYDNLARHEPNRQLIALCASRLGSDFHQVVNIGRQTAFEHRRYVKLAINRFCQQDDATVLSGEFSEEEVVSLRHAFCHGKSVDDILKKNGLQNGDRVFTASGIQIWQDNHLIAATAPLQQGDIVYRINAPITPFLFDGKTLSEAKEGAVVMRHQQMYRVVHHHLQLVSHP